MVILEIDAPVQLRPGRFASTLGNRKFRRFWWLWFAVAYWPGDIKEYGEAVRNGVWIDS